MSRELLVGLSNPRELLWAGGPRILESKGEEPQGSISHRTMWKR